MLSRTEIMNSKKLGDYIRNLRKDLGLSQQELAKQAGLARSYISRLESNQFEAPSAMILIKLASALKVSHEVLFQVAGYVPHMTESELPSFDVYMRTKYPELPMQAIKEIELFMSFLEQRYNNKYNHDKQK